MRLAVLAFFLALASSASAQRFVRKWNNFSDSVTGSYVHYVDPLGAILLDGYLRGKLKGYSFDIKSEGIKFKPLPPDWRPPRWDPNESYFFDDRVEFNGKFYVSLNEPKSGTKPGSSEYWQLINLTGPTVSTRHSFPGPKDELQVSDFLDAFIFSDFRCRDPWSQGYDYYNDDEVIFNHKIYRVLRDNRNRQPDVSTDDWEVTESWVNFRMPKELSRIQEVYWQGEGSEHVPQMISAEYFDENSGWWRNPGLYFYYQDAIEYVAGQRRIPLLYSSTLGYVGTSQLILGQDERTPMVNFILENLHNGTIRLSKNDIADQALYGTFTLGTKPLSELDWRVMQDMLTNEIRVSYVAPGSNKLVVKVPWTAMESTIKAKNPAPRILNYQQALEWDIIASELDTIESVDTLAALPYRPVTIPPPASMYFIEERHARLHRNPGLDIALTELWSRLVQTANSREIAQQQPYERLFPGNQPLPEMTFCNGASSWKLEEGHTLQPPFEAFAIDVQTKKFPTVGFAVQYKRTVKPGKALFEPVKLAVEVRVDGEYSRYYYFRWMDVMKVSASDFRIAPLIHKIRTGQLEFDESEVVYGLVAER